MEDYSSFFLFMLCFVPVMFTAVVTGSWVFKRYLK
jgi:hypothetical protein